MLDKCEWLNFPWALDVNYTHIDNAPILAQLIKRYRYFWDGQFWYQIQAGVYILRYPDWRKGYRVDHEKVRVRAGLSKNQCRLDEVCK